MGYKMVCNASNKHIHLDQEDLDTLFGEGYELTKKKDLIQPGQFASEEMVEVIGPKGSFKKVRVLGPVRPDTQLELSLTDCRQIGIQAPIRESGDVAGTPGCKIIGPKGEVDLEYGVMVAQRHAHFRTDQAEEAGVKNGDLVKIKIESEKRTTIYDDVVCRVKDSYLAEVHVDTDEANAAGMGGGCECEIIVD
jgi:putative phosphotransacetylase